jgi:hypothetical protein
LLAATAHAGFIKEWSLEELAKADVLAVARVESVSTSAAPARQLSDREAVHTCTADLAVLRSFGEIPGQIRLAYECYKDRGPGVSGYPILPRLERGQVRVFPLKRTDATWSLFANEGVGLLMPALTGTGNLAGTPLGYLVDELANSFLYGTYRQLFDAAQYGGAQPPKLVLERIETDLPPGDPRWLDIGTAALATTSVPRPAVDKLKTFAGRALSHVPASRRRAGVVRNMLAHSDVHGWGSATTLVSEFKDDPLLLKLLPGYLAKLQPGSLSIAWSLARNGQEAALPISLDTATRTLELPKVEVNDLYASTYLLVRYGSDTQFEKLLGALNAAKLHDRERYMQLWQVAYGEEGPRILRMIGVLLADERPYAPGSTMRYCDIAGGRLQTIAKQEFGFSKQWDQDLAQRKAAVARARNWLRDSMRR